VDASSCSVSRGSKVLEQCLYERELERIGRIELVAAQYSSDGCAFLGAKRRPRRFSRPFHAWFCSAFSADPHTLKVKKSSMTEKIHGKIRDTEGISATCAVASGSNWSADAGCKVQKGEWRWQDC
jgi:hypothetical protein